MHTDPLGVSDCNFKVSVLVPAYNASAFIHEALESALSQTHFPHEVIVVDDGSSDNTREIVAQFGPPVQLFIQANAGPGKARNLAASKATGDWLAFLDADDIWSPDKTAMQLKLAEPSDGLVYCDRLNFGQVGALSTRQSSAVKLFEGDVFRQLLSKGNFITLSSVMVRTNIFRELGGFDERREIIGVEDWDLWLKVAKRCKVRLCPEALVKYRCQNGSVSKNISSMFRAQELVLDENLDGSPLHIRRIARATSAGISAWFAKNQAQFMLAAKLYLRAIWFVPTEFQSYKELFKCIIRRR